MSPFVQTNKSAFFAAQSDQVANEWMKKIQESIERHGAEHRERKLSNATNTNVNPSASASATSNTAVTDTANSSASTPSSTAPSPNVKPPTTPPRPTQESRLSSTPLTPSPGP